MASPSGNNFHKVFFYGTLKKGEPNHQWFLNHTQGYHKFLYTATTKDKYPLIIGTKYNIPFLLYSPGHGTFVNGEVYDVDDTVLRNLDVLEDHPSFYIRELHDIVPSTDPNSIVKVWIYVIKDFKNELLHQPFYESYSSSGSHGLKYVNSENADLDDLNA